MKIRAYLIPGITLALFSIIQVAQGDIVTTTVESTFNTNLTNLGLTNVTTQNFDSTASGTAIPNGTILGAFTFTTVPAGSGVDSTFTTTSGSNYLGVPPGGTFSSGGSSFTFTFAATNAFSMKIITSSKPPTLSNDDFTLMAGGQSLSMNTADSTLVSGFPPFSSESYYFGIINTDTAFTSATFTSGADSRITYFVDDLVIANVPEPGTAGLIGLTMIVGFVRRRRGSKFQN